jgi:hypothetical protein
MRSVLSIAAVCLAFSAFSAAQGIGSPPSRSSPSQFSPSTAESVIGPNGTYYVLLTGTGSTASSPTWELEAIGVTTTPATTWTANLTGEISSILPGVNTVFVVQTVTSGSGTTKTSTTSILPFSAASGAPGTIISPAGRITGIQISTVGGSDYLYVETTSTSTTQSGGTTTNTTTRSLTIYSPTGTVIKTVGI